MRSAARSVTGATDVRGCRSMRSAARSVTGATDVRGCRSMRSAARSVTGATDVRGCRSMRSAARSVTGATEVRDCCSVRGAASNRGASGMTSSDGCVFCYDATGNVRSAGDMCSAGGVRDGSCMGSGSSL